MFFNRLGAIQNAMYMFTVWDDKSLFQACCPVFSTVSFHCYRFTPVPRTYPHHDVTGHTTMTSRVALPVLQSTPPHHLCRLHKHSHALSTSPPHHSTAPLTSKNLLRLLTPCIGTKTMFILLSYIVFSSLHLTSPRLHRLCHSHISSGTPCHSHQYRAHVNATVINRLRLFALHITSSSTFFSLLKVVRGSPATASPPHTRSSRCQRSFPAPQTLHHPHRTVYVTLIFRLALVAHRIATNLQTVYLTVINRLQLCALLLNNADHLSYSHEPFQNRCISLHSHPTVLPTVPNRLWILALYFTITYVHCFIRSRLHIVALCLKTTPSFIIV